MTETDATKRPLTMPLTFIPYLDNHRLYKIFKDMVTNLVLHLPNDHLKFMKVFVRQHQYSSTDPPRVMILVSPELKNIDVVKMVKEMVKLLGAVVITRRLILDNYHKHEDFNPDCVSPELLSEVTKLLTLKDPVPVTGWLMFDHPCSVREAKCLQQDGVLPNVTLALMPPPPQSEPTENPLTPARSFYDQEFDGLKYCYRATLKEVHVKPDDATEKISHLSINAIMAARAGQQGAHQGYNVLGAPGVYRVLIIGPRGSGKSTQAKRVAETFGLVYVNFKDLLLEAQARNDEIGVKLRKYGVSTQLKADIVFRRITQKDCIDRGWILVNFPNNGAEFDSMDMMKTPPNRIIFLSVEWATCRRRIMSRGVDWCSGGHVEPGTPRAMLRNRDYEAALENDLDYYFTEALAEMRAACGLSAININADESIDQLQVRIEAAIIAAPAYDIEHCSMISENVRGE